MTDGTHTADVMMMSATTIPDNSKLNKLNNSRILLKL
jgi:hypothetical protein